jgi:surfeit locus 1 family protein
MVLAALLAALLFAGFFALGTWQLQRRVWKLDLIERVDARVHAPPEAPPARFDPRNDEYRHVRLQGRFLHDRETLVQAATRRGAGHWVLTPLQTVDGAVVLINRGFVPPEQRAPAERADNQPAGEVVVTGLLRLTEPHGGFLRSNDAATDRWFSRDVEAIAKARQLTNAAPYFVDADAGPAEQVPVGGLTVVSFPNSHLVYALTWYGLALLVAAAVFWVVREERRRRFGEDAALDAARTDDNPPPSQPGHSGTR